MAVTTEERKAAALERMAQLMEHGVYHEKTDLLASKHSADCVGCMEVRAEAAAKKAADDAAKAEADAKAAAERDAAEEADRKRAQEEADAAAREAAEKKAAEKSMTDAQRGAQAAAELQGISAIPVIKGEKLP